MEGFTDRQTPAIVEQDVVLRQFPDVAPLFAVPDRGVRLYLGASILIGTNCACFALGYIFFVPHFGFLGYSLTQYLAALTSLVLLLVRDSFATIKIQEVLAIGLATLLLWVSRIAV